MPRLRLFSTMILFFASILNGTLLHAATPPVTLAQLAELTPSTRATNDWFGISIAVSGNTVVVGDFDANIETFRAVYVYVKPSTGWANMTQVAKLTSSDNGEGFGTSVAINDNVIVVGAANTSNFHTLSPTPGAAYVFVKPSSGWTDATETVKLIASDGQPGDAFGNSVSISGPTIAVGAFFAPDSSGKQFRGKGLRIRPPSNGWSGNLNETAKLTASDSQLLNYMGASIAVSGNTVVAGSYGHNNFKGTAYVFVAPSGVWSSMTQTAELTASDGKGSDAFGFSSSISGDTVLVGAVSALAGRGAGYIFVKPSTGWVSMTQTSELRALNAAPGDGFGQSAGISGNEVVIGAPGAKVGTQIQGAAYFFAKPSSGWVNATSARDLIASDGAAFDNLGVSVAVSGSTIVAGAPKSATPGSAYVFGP